MKPPNSTRPEGTLLCCRENSQCPCCIAYKVAHGLFQCGGSGRRIGIYRRDKARDRWRMYILEPAQVLDIPRGSIRSVLVTRNCDTCLDWRVFSLRSSPARVLYSARTMPSIAHKFSPCLQHTTRRSIVSDVQYYSDSMLDRRWPSCPCARRSKPSCALEYDPCWPGDTLCRTRLACAFVPQP